jgi:membrane-bound ClpP family serine protease
VRGARLRPSRRRRIQGIALFVLGIALLVCGMLVPLKVFSVPVVSVVGFFTMFVGAALAWVSLRQGAAADTPKGEQAKAQRSGFTQRMEERFRKRFEGE